MPKFARKYSDNDRLAMLALADAGMTSRQISEELARNGHPAFQVKPLEAPPGSIRKLVQRERAKHLGWTHSPLAQADPVDALEELTKRLISIAERETLRLSAAQARGSLEPAKLKAMAGTLRELRGALPPASRSKATKQEGPEQAPDSLEARLSQAKWPDPADPPLPSTEPTPVPTTTQRETATFAPTTTATHNGHDESNDGQRSGRRALDRTRTDRASSGTAPRCPID